MEMMNVEISIPKMAFDKLKQDKSVKDSAAGPILATLTVIGIVQSHHDQFSLQELLKLREWTESVFLSVGNEE